MALLADVEDCNKGLFLMQGPVPMACCITGHTRLPWTNQNVCLFLVAEGCVKGLLCRGAHTVKELRVVAAIEQGKLAPEYKTELCPDWPECHAGGLGAACQTDLECPHVLRGVGWSGPSLKQGICLAPCSQSVILICAPELSCSSVECPRPFDEVAVQA